MQPKIALEYGRQPEARPRWLTVLGVTSLALGAIGVYAGVLRARDAWE